MFTQAYIGVFGELTVVWVNELLFQNYFQFIHNFKLHGKFMNIMHLHDMTPTAHSTVSTTKQ